MYKKLSNNNTKFQAYKRFGTLHQPGNFSCEESELHYSWPPKKCSLALYQRCKYWLIVSTQNVNSDIITDQFSAHNVINLLSKIIFSHQRKKNTLNISVFFLLNLPLSPL